MPNNKKRVLVTISYSFSVRYIYRTGLLSMMKDFCEPVIAITWDQEDLINELKQDGLEVIIIPESSRGTAYSGLRTKIDLWFSHFRLKSQSKGIQQKYLNQFIPKRKRIRRKVIKWFNLFKFYLPGYSKKLFKTEQALLLSDTNYLKLFSLVDGLNIDAVFTVTPFHKQEDVLLQVCKNQGKLMLTSILSFDNITKRGWIPVEYDAYLVWNAHNKKQLYRIYPFTKNKPVHIIGAAQFDFYFNDRYLMPAEQWKKQMGLPATNQKVILYAGGPSILFPNEPQYLIHLINAIKAGEIRNNPVILLRCHPTDNIERWKDAVGNNMIGVFDASWTGQENIFNANVTCQDITKLCSTLAYTDVHINLCSTMTVDGSTFNKPQIGPAYDEINPFGESLLRRMYLQDHFLPIIETNGLTLANSKAQLIQYVNDALERPDLFNKKCRNILDEIITYADGRSTKRVAEAICKLL